MRKLKNNELTRFTIEEFKKEPKIPLVVILDNIRSMNNIGSVFRTADAFKVEHVYLCGITACPPNKDIHKTALGATESVNWSYEKETLDVVKELQKNGVKILSIEQTEGSVPLDEFEINKNDKYAVILGNEVKGVQQKVVDESDFAIEIPQYGTKHSINVSVCNGIVVWEFFKALQKK